ncbi:transmembrane protein 208-like isoform X3 [Gigantopelta aegis]|uniref:transmembrane protein 208-like isoform X3 n=1 Tax=Gigantopelta aegis TaxID=1735272 RepID=UPI001B88E76E|nr:transmembrane protein 208-like isoform X3 [Gigantopelta aegis]
MPCNFNLVPKGKQGTRGQKQIVTENKSTLQFYLMIILSVNIVYAIVQYVFFWEKFTAGVIAIFLFAVCVNLGSYQFMVFMSRATYSTEGALLDSGGDLNMQSGMGENIKDLILLTCIIQGLSLVSNYFWILWLLAPGRAFYMLWVNILGPWFFAEAPEVDEKKQKKMERKMKRH